MSYNSIDSARGTATTTNATSTQLVSFDFSQSPYVNCSVLLECRVVARKVSDNSTMCVVKSGAAKCDSSSNVSFVGSLTNILPATEDLSMALTSVSITCSGTILSVNGVGLASSDVEWMVVLAVYIN